MSRLHLVLVATLASGSLDVASQHAAGAATLSDTTAHLHPGAPELLSGRKLTDTVEYRYVTDGPAGATRDLGGGRVETRTTTYRGKPALMLVSAFTSRTMAFHDTSVVELDGLAPLTESHLARGRRTRFEYSGARVHRTVLAPDSAASDGAHQYDEPIFHFNELTAIARALPLRRGYEVIVPLYSQMDDVLERDTLRVLGPDSGGVWLVRFSDQVIAGTYAIDPKTRRIVRYEIASQKGTGRGRWVIRRVNPAALTVLDTAIARMGGADSLRNVMRARFEMMTQWQRTNFDSRPYPDQPSYESHSDLRDYAINAWRNTRRFGSGAQQASIVDVVRDSVAIRRSPFGGSGGVASPAVVAAGQWAPLNVAYVDERRELFAMAPERLLLSARDANDLRALPDTTIGGAVHARVSATVDRFPTTLFIRRSTGFLSAARFRTAEPNDFGLVPWGEMEVEFWYSGWRKSQNGVVFATQIDVRRVGAPYKRMTVLSAQFNPPAMPDSFVVSDSLRTAFIATARRPMHDVPLDSARIIDGRFASFGAFGAPAGAVKLGKQWVLLETGQAPLSAERAVGWLAHADAGSTVAAALLTTPSAAGPGGVPWLVTHGVPVDVGPGAAPFVDAVLRGYATPKANVAAVTRGRWLRVSGDSLWLEPIDLPDVPGVLVAYAPSLEWLYTASAASPLQQQLVLAHARAAGWRVSRVGHARAVSTMLPEAQRLAPVATR